MAIPSITYNRTSISDYSEFRSFCQAASENEFVFNNFKQNEEFKNILEHVSFEQGLQYAKKILENNNLKKIQKSNDEQGNPEIFQYPEPFGKVSPSTLRYIKVLSDLMLYFGSLENLSIVEIGVGYGGQAKIIQDYFNIKEYSLVDLSEVLNLTKKYLSKYNYKNLNFIDVCNLPQKNYDLLISNYAISECTKEIQDLYIEKIINNSKNGYITANDIGKYFGINNYGREDWNQKIKNSQILEESPKTHADNYLLIF